MPKRKKHSLTPRVKDEIKASKGKVKLKDYAGEALAYINQYRQLAKARKAKADATLTIGKKSVKHNTELYSLVKKMADSKNITVKHFAAAYSDEVQEFLRKGNIPNPREADYLLKDVETMPKGRTITLNGKKVSRSAAAFEVKMFKFNIINYTSSWIANIESYYDYEGNLHIDMPTAGEYDDILSRVDSGEITGEEGEQELREYFEEEYPDEIELLYELSE